MRFVYPRFDGDTAIQEWVLDRVPYVDSIPLDETVAQGIEDDSGQPVFGIVWSNHRPSHGDIQYTLAADKGTWRKDRRMIAGILAYPFLQLGCIRITGYVRADNKLTIKLAKTIGAKPEGVLRNGFGPGHDMIVFGMLREEAQGYFNGR